MKTLVKILLAGVLALAASRGSAQTQLIYSNYFDPGAAGTTLNGTAPTVANTLLGGLGGATWVCTYTNDALLPASGTVLANGSVQTNPGCALLPFIPQPGCVYFLSATMTLPSGMPNWIAMGFAASATQTNNQAGTYSRFTDNPPGGYAWMNITAGSAQNAYGGRGAANPLGSTTVIPAGITNITFVLNTVNPQWSFSAFLGGTVSGASVAGGTQIGTNFIYGANPPIAWAGIGENSFAGQSTAGIAWNSWSLSVTQVTTSTPTNTYWIGPAASGTGDGSSAANAASFVNYSFWSTVQGRLQGADVVVNVNNGSYTAAGLNLTNLGNAAHRLTLQAVSLYQPVFSGNNGTLIFLYGSQNIKFYGLVLTGPSAYWGLECEPNGLNPCRNIELSYCQLINLTNVLYGALGVVDGARDILVDNCTFSNLSANNGNHQHMIYASHDIVGIVATNCTFKDCYADYVRFRDNSEYCTVENCAFISTVAASAWPFVSAELYNVTNSDAAGDEFFGNNFQVSKNTFTYQVSGGAGPYSALHFSDDACTPYTYDCDLTSAQATALANGSVPYQQGFLQTNLGITASAIKMFGNSYGSLVANQVDYTYIWDGIQPNGGWQGTVNISGVADASGKLVSPAPSVRNGDFDRQGLALTPQTDSTPNECLFQTWFCNPKYADILWHPGFAGTSNALELNLTNTQYVYQAMTPPGPDWTMDFMFALGNNSANGTGVIFKFDLFHDDLSGSKLSVGVDHLGRVGVFNTAGSFVVLPELGPIAFSVDVNGNNNYTDPGDTLNVYRMRVVGNYGGTTPCYSIYTSAANSLALSQEALNLATWVNNAPFAGISSPETIAIYNYANAVIVDQIAFGPGLAEQPPVITNAVLANNQFVVSGTNGYPGDTYYLLATTNLAQPGANWTTVGSGIFNTNGGFSITNTVAPSTTPWQFYRLQLQ